MPLVRSKIKMALFVLACLLTLGFAWLTARWSARRKALFMFCPCSLAAATHFLVVEEEVMGGTTIVRRQDKRDARRDEQVASFCYHDRNYLYH